MSTCYVITWKWRVVHNLQRRVQECLRAKREGSNGRFPANTISLPVGVKVCII